MKELILNGKTGFLVSDLNEAVESVRFIPGIKRIDCRIWAESNFTRSIMAGRYIDVYKEILKIK